MRYFWKNHAFLNYVLCYRLGSLQVDAGVFEGLHMMRLEVWPLDKGSPKVTTARTKLQVKILYTYGRHVPMNML